MQTGFAQYSHHNQVLELNTPDPGYFHTAYAFLHFEKIAELCQAQFSMVETTEDSVKQTRTIKIKQVSDSAAIGTNRNIIIRINEQSKIIEAYSDEMDCWGGHQYDHFQLLSVQFNLPGIDDSLRLQSLSDTIRKVVDYRTTRKIQETVAKFNKNQIEQHPARDFSWATMTGDSFVLNSLRGSVVILNFTFRACAGCVVAKDPLRALLKKYKRSGLRLVNINPVDQPSKAIKAYYGDEEWPVLLESEYIADLYYVAAYPTFCIIDRSGKVIKLLEGYNEDRMSEIETLIKDHL